MRDNAFGTGKIWNGTGDWLSCCLRMFRAGNDAFSFLYEIAGALVNRGVLSILAFRGIRHSRPNRYGEPRGVQFHLHSLAGEAVCAVS